MKKCGFSAVRQVPSTWGGASPSPVGPWTIRNASAKEGGGVVDLEMLFEDGLFSKVSHVMFDGLSALTSLHVEVAGIQIPINSPRQFE